MAGEFRESKIAGSPIRMALPGWRRLAFGLAE
jgi:hypothetical protein